MAKGGTEGMPLLHSRPLKDEPFSRKALVALILPLIAEQFLSVLVGMADTLMVSGVGESAVAAVSTVDILNIMFVQLFSSMSAGGSVVSAQYLGKGDRKSASAAAKQLILATFGIAAVVTTIIALFHRSIIGLMDGGQNPETVEQSCTYLLITSFAYPFMGLYGAGAGLQRAMGNTKTSMWTSVAVNIVNICGNAILIHPCGLGVMGAALSTLISRIVASVIVLWVLRDKSKPIYLESPRKEPHFFRLDFTMIRRILRVGLPNGLENSLFQAGRVIIMSIITTFSTPLRAANGICNTLTSVVNIPGYAVGSAAPAIIGQLIGADKKEEARRYGNKLLIIMYLVVLPTNVILFLFADPIVRLFNLSEAGIPAAVQLLHLYTVLTLFTWAPSFGLPNILRAAGDARYTMVVAILSMVILRLGASYLLVYGMGLSLLGIWLAMHLDWVGRGICFGVRFHSGKWLNKKVI